MAIKYLDAKRIQGSGSDKDTLVTAEDTGIYGGDAGEWTFADNGGSGSTAGTTGFSIATSQGDLTGNAARIGASGRDYNSKFDLVTDGGLTAIDNNTAFVMEWDTYRGGSDGGGDTTVDHPTLYLDVDGTGADAAPTNSGRYIGFGWENAQNIFKIYVKNSSGTAYNSTISGITVAQARNTTRYYRATLGETGYTSTARLYMYTTSAARASDTQSSGVYQGTGATVFTGTAMTGSGAGMTAWAAANPFRYLVLPTYNNDVKDFAHKNVKFWNDTTSNIGTPYMNLTFDARPASSTLPENTIFEETNTYKYFWLQNHIWFVPLRAIIAGGTQSDLVAGNRIEYFSISNLGNATTWGANLTVARAGIGSGQCNNDLRAVFVGGET